MTTQQTNGVAAPKPIYRRVLLKLSGEALANKSGNIIDVEYLKKIASVIQRCRELGVQFGIIVGAGNIWRGKFGESMDRTRADHMGMLATAINAIAIQDAFLSMNIETRVMTAIAMHEFAEPYIRNKAIHHLESDRIVIFGCGLGIPFITTDTAAVLRGIEINADVVLMAKNVDGVYDFDPEKVKDAQKYDILDPHEVVVKRLQALDITAASLAEVNNIDIHVFGLSDPENIFKVVTGEDIGTIITGGNQK